LLAVAYIPLLSTKTKGRQRANLVLKNIFALKLPENKQGRNSQAVPNTTKRRMDHRSLESPNNTACQCNCPEE
jgi:hypothetical protein